MQFEFRVSCKSSKAAKPKPKQMQMISWSSHKFIVDNAKRATEILRPDDLDGLYEAAQS